MPHKAPGPIPHPHVQPPTPLERDGQTHDHYQFNSRSSSDTMAGSPATPTSPLEDNRHEKIELRPVPPSDPNYLAPDQATLSPSESREANNRLVDDLELLRAERMVSNQENQERLNAKSHRSHNPVPEDAFNPATEEKPTIREGENTAVTKVWKAVKTFPRFVRYFVYMLPVGCILLIPILLGRYKFSPDTPIGGPGGVYLMWFGIWLEILWLSLWASRILVSGMPWLFGFCAKLGGSSSSKKWKDIGYQLEMPTALFIWMLATLISFLPIVNNKRAPNPDGDGLAQITWIDVVNKVIIAVFVLAACNFVEKILIQWIATSFHLRTYAYRIDQNKLDISHLVKLYQHCKQKVDEEDPIWDQTHGSGGTPSGLVTPMQAIQNNARHAFNKVGNVANKMAGDFTGRKVDPKHPKRVVLELLRTTSSAHALARLLYRVFKQPDAETITMEDIKMAFPENPEDAEACFATFDKDLNGDISDKELEDVCNEIHLEKKAIAASLKDLDSVIRKLDKVFLFIVFIIAVIVFISILSGSAAGALASAGTTVLGLAWMLQATAQEFLQSIIFVFVKHPFDVGDRVTIYGNTGMTLTGDDYYVTEISLLYTEFKKMEGHIVQAPNSTLNTLFILNQRRSTALADPIELKLRFGTSSETIEELKARMLDFIFENKRDYQARIITEVRTIDEVWSVTIGFIFFHKSNFQNELLRLQRHNKFAGELMRQMALLGIEGPRKMEPGGTKDFPFYWASVPTPANQPHPYDQQAPPPSAASLAMRRRAESRAADDPGFQDVFSSRKGGEPSLQRMVTIRQGEVARTSSAELDRLPSRGSNASRRVWGRPRSKSNVGGNNIV